MSNGGLVRKIFPDEHELMAALDEMRREHQTMYAQLLDAGINPEDLLRFMPFIRVCTLVRVLYSVEIPLLAKHMGISAKKIDAIERGDLARIDPQVLARYVSALELNKLFNAWAARNTSLAERLHTGQLRVKAKRPKAAPDKNKGCEVCTLQFKVTLCQVHPTVWRRFLVPEDLSLRDFHLVLQSVMGWENLYSHEFVIRGLSFLDPDDAVDPDSHDERQFKMSDLKLRSGQKIDYWYDMDAEWKHEIKLERRIKPGSPGSCTSPFCIEGERACPPEDSGGPYLYPELLRALENPEHPRHAEALSVLGAFNPTQFDLARVNDLIRPKTSRKPSA